MSLTSTEELCFLWENDNLHLKFIYFMIQNKYYYTFKLQLHFHLYLNPKKILKHHLIRISQTKQPLKILSSKPSTNANYIMSQ